MKVASTKPVAVVSRPDLESRVASRKQSLISEIVEHKKNSCRAGAAASVDRLKDQLSELRSIVKETGVDGWANLATSTTLKLEDWVAR